MPQGAVFDRPHFRDDEAAKVANERNEPNDHHRRIHPARNGFIRQKELIPGIIPFSRATLWRKVKAKEFPAPVKLSANVTAWRVEDVRAWMAALN